ncbi:MAG: sugar phosphate isomerase/epimerase family protein, partial [Armatimonadia bacterium]
DDNVTLVDTLHNAHGLRTPIVRVWASDVGSAKATPEVWKCVIEEAQQACDRAAKMNVIFAAEMHDGTLADTGPTARRLVEEVNRPNFRLNFQVGNYDQEDQLQRLEEVLPYVVHMHCQNFVKGNGDGQYKRVQIADGFVDYPSLFGRLKASGYAGHVAVEFAAEEGENKEQSLRKDLEYLSAF